MAASALALFNQAEGGPPDLDDLDPESYDSSSSRSALNINIDSASDEEELDDWDGGLESTPGGVPRAASGHSQSSFASLSSTSKRRSRHDAAGVPGTPP